ncbi:MAG: hypothetical protein ABEJ79_01475 [Halolamina sp.]
MFRRLREQGPAVAVPAAWAVVAGAVVGIVSTRTLLIAHVVMAVLQAGFLAASWTDMSEGALCTWRRIIGVGLLVTVAGAVGLAASLSALRAAAPIGWALLPAAGLVDVAQRGGGPTYLGAGVVSGLGGLVLAAGAVVGTAVVVAGVVLAGVGQTIGILRAAADTRASGGTV